MTFEKLSGLVIGGGSIGQRHIFNLQRLGVRNLSIYDSNELVSKNVSKKFNISRFVNFESALASNPDFSFICTFPSSHVKFSKKCLLNGSHIFIEKPLSNNNQGIKSLKAVSIKKRMKIAVGYNLRFEPCIQFLKKKYGDKPPLFILSQFGNHISKWRPGTNFKDHYVLKKGGGIILDSSHDYDFIRWLIDDKVISVFCNSRKEESISSETESIASINLKFKNGVIATIILDNLRPNYHRTCEFFFNNSILKWSFLPKTHTWRDYNASAYSEIVSQKNNSKKILKKFTYDFNQTYILETKDFLNSILFDKKPQVDIDDAYNSLQIGLASIESSQKNKEIKIKTN